MLGKNNNLLKKAFIRQRDQSDCGVACLASILKYYEANVSLEKLRELSGTGKSGSTLLGLMQASKEIGLDAEGFEAEIQHLKTLEHIAILHVVIDRKMQHYVVLFGYNNEMFQIFDPAKGFLRMTEEGLSKIWQSKTLLLLKPTKNLEKIIEKRGKKRAWLVALVKQDYSTLGIATFLGLVIAFLSISTAVFSQKLIDHILPNQDNKTLIIGLGLLIVLLLAKSGILYLRTLLILRQSKDFNNRIIQKFYNSLMYLPKRFFDTRKTGELIARMNDTNRIQHTISFVLGDTLIQSLFGITSLIFVFIYSWQVGLLLLGFIPFYVLLVWRYTKPITKSQREVMQSYAMNEANYVDTLQGIEVIKNQNKESVFSKITETIYGNFQNKVFNLGLIGNKYGVNIQIIGVLATTGVLALSSFLVIQERLQLGELVALFFMAGNLFPAIEAIARANIQVREAKIAFDRMYEFTSMSPDFEPIETQESLPTIERLSVQNLSFRFPGRKQLLKNINLELNKGQITGLLGESGGGKSTFIQILQKFYTPESGSILIDELSYEQIHTTSLRSKMGVVPQQVKIFNGSLLYNINLGKNNINRKQLKVFMKDFGFEPYFLQLPQGYSTIIGEEGVNISGGQKQLVGLARALWTNPDILLLDEATSALDRKTEKFVLNLLNKLKKDKIILLVTHRITTVAKSDMIYVLENNIISTKGTPFVLMKSKNFFSEFFEEDQKISRDSGLYKKH